MTTYTLRLVADNSKTYASLHPVILRCTSHAELKEFMKTNYPNAAELKTMSEERKAHFSGKFKPYLHLIETPLNRQSYITEYSI